MRLSKLTIAALVSTMAAVATAQPAQPNGRDANRPQPQQPQAALVLASVPQPSEAGTPAPDAQNPQAPPKRRAARVTSCRCGDSGQ